MDTLSKHYKPAPLEIVERFRFNSRIRKPGESVAAFVSELRALAEFCNFGDTLEVMLRDRIVCGINEDSIQRRLLSDPTMDYAKAVETALNLETAAQSMKTLKSKAEGVSSSNRPVSPQVNKTTTSSNASNPVPTCYRCGIRGHAVSKCWVDRNIICHFCQNKGHMQRACKAKNKGKEGAPVPDTATPRPMSKTRSKSKLVRQVQEEESDSADSGESFLRLVESRGVVHSPHIHVQVKVDDCVVNMEVDTGAAMSLMSQTTFQGLWPGRDLEPSQIRLRAYTKEPIPVVGCCSVNVEYNGQSAQLPLLVVGGSGPTLLGRDWLRQIKLDWRQIHHVHSSSLQALLARYPAVFQDGLGKLRGYQARILVEPGTVPSFNPARSVLYALRDKVNQELQRLQDEGILEPVETAEWAAPIVAVLKRDKSSVRICGDFSVTVNPVSRLDRYPIPKPEDLFAKLANGKQFSTLDLSHAYQQIPLEAQSRKYVVINTHRGLFQYTRLPFGISSATGIFQHVMESLLQGIDGVVVYLDDILVTGNSEEAHLRTLEEVLHRLEQAGLKVKQSKCAFMRPSVTYLGHKIDAEGLHPLDDRVRAIRDAPTPTSVTKLKSFLGMLSYYNKFLPSLSSVLYPLHRLLRKDIPWVWGAAQSKAFSDSKKLLLSSNCLTHFDSSLDFVVACDASNYGLGAVISHKMPDGSDRPIAYASRTLNRSEQNYS